MQPSEKLGRLLKRVEKPGRYVGGEIHSVQKNPNQADIRFGFAFPDIYEIGMSYIGMQILYHILNQKKDIYCERIFAPALDMEELMRTERVELFTLETATPVKELDFLGFTLQYELSYTNVLNMLDLGKIPLLRAQRNDEFPIIVAGGPCALNPEPLADIIDVFLIGDGEDLLPAICQAKKATQTKEEYLKSICKMNGVYVPSTSQPKVKRTIVKDLDQVPFPTAPMVPLIDVVQNRAVVEIFRGCSRGCRFCQAGMIYRPVRERSVETIRNLTVKQLENTGHEELSLLSLSTSDHSKFETIALELMDYCKGQNVSLSLPSLRLDSFSFPVLQKIQRYKKSGLTFAPEAGTQRLRNVINKGITEEQIYDAMRQALELGWDKIKLYFMIGLPTETYEDLDGIVQIAKNIKDLNFQIKGKKGGRFHLTVSVANFVPKAHTPFQWTAQDTPESFKKKHEYLSSRLKIKNISFRYHDTDVSTIEGVFARGDRRVGKALFRAFQLGCKFDSWTEHFNGSLWRQSFLDTNIDPSFYNTRQYSYDDVLPWDFIDSFVSKEYLMKEYHRALEGKITPDCRNGCRNCGINREFPCRQEDLNG